MNSDPARPYKGFGDPASRSIHASERVQYTIDQLRSDNDRRLTAQRANYITGKIDGLQLALKIMEGE